MYNVKMYNENAEKLKKNYFEYENNLKLLHLNFPNIPHFENLVHHIKQTVYYSEHFSYRKRDLKLKNLKQNFFYPFNTAKIINNTGITIPPDVISLLWMGNEFSVGGSTKKNCSDIYTELNKLWEIFLPKSRKAGVSELDIENITIC